MTVANFPFCGGGGEKTGASAKTLEHPNGGLYCSSFWILAPLFAAVISNTRETIDNIKSTVANVKCDWPGALIEQVGVEKNREP